MPQKEEYSTPPPFSCGAEEEPGVRVPYQVVRHALGKSGPVRIHGLELKRVGDVVVIRPVNPRDQPLPHFIEVPLRPEVLRHLARVLDTWATQAETEMTALRCRLQEAERMSADPEAKERS